MCSERLREWMSGATADPGGQSLGRRRFEHPSEPGPLSLGSHDDDVGPLARSQAVHFPEPRIDDRRGRLTQESELRFVVDIGMFAQSPAAAASADRNRKAVVVR